MIVTKKALPRRTFLRGVGATLALPLLDAMVPSMTALAQTPANPVRRLGFVYIPMGSTLSQWTPAGEAGSFLGILPPPPPPAAGFWSPPPLPHKEREKTPPPTHPPPQPAVLYPRH